MGSDPAEATRVAGARRTLQEVDAALARMDAGEFGLCVHCGNPIPAERLEFLPQASGCVPCVQALASTENPGGSPVDDLVTTNMRNWDERVADHVVAYDAEAFADDPHAIGVGVEAEVLAPHLPGGSFEGLDVVHLQCHIGTDTISLGRRGARVVGTDLSGEAVTTARRLATRAGLVDVSFVQTTNEDAPDVWAGSSTWCSPRWGSSPGCRTSGPGRGRWPACCDRAGLPRPRRAPHPERAAVRPGRRPARPG